MGAGSLGIVVGGLISQSGGDVVLVDVNQENVTALNKNGARILGAVDLRIPVRAIRPDQLAGAYDLIILLTKQTNNHSVLTTLGPHLSTDSTVCTLQNGIPEFVVASYLGLYRVVGGTVGFGATWIEPGVSAVTSTASALAQYGFDIGEIDGRVTTRIQMVRDVLAAVGGCQIVDNLMSIRWSKLLMNATFSGASTALGCTFGEVLENDIAMQFLSHIADEAIKTAHSAGVHLAPMQGEDIELLELHRDEDVTSKMPLYRRIWDRHSSLKASMLQDIEKGRRTEIHQINGHICTVGKAHDVKTPFNDLVVELVSEADRNKKVPHFSETLDRMKRLLN